MSSSLITALQPAYSVQTGSSLSDGRVLKHSTANHKMAAGGRVFKALDCKVAGMNPGHNGIGDFILS